MAEEEKVKAKLVAKAPHAIRDEDTYFDCGRGYLWSNQHDVVHMGTINYVEAAYPDPTCDNVLNHMNEDMKEWFQSKWVEEHHGTFTNWNEFLLGAFSWSSTPEKQELTVNN